MTDAVFVAIAAALPTTITALGGFIVLIRRGQRLEEKVDKVEKQTNSMNSQMTDSARKEGRIEGKERAEQVAAVAAASIASVTPVPIPLVIAPDVKQEDIVKWVAQGYAQGILYEKARRATEGNGPKS